MAISSIAKAEPHRHEGGRKKRGAWEATIPTRRAHGRHGRGPQSELVLVPAYAHPQSMHDATQPLERQDGLASGAREGNPQAGPLFPEEQNPSPNKGNGMRGGGREGEGGKGISVCVYVPRPPVGTIRVSSQPEQGPTRDNQERAKRKGDPTEQTLCARESVCDVSPGWRRHRGTERAPPAHSAMPATVLHPFRHR